MTIAIAEAIGAQTNANMNSQTVTAESVISLTETYLPLQQGWSAILNQDSLNIFIESLKVSSDPTAAPQVAALSEVKNTHSTQSGLDTGQLDNVIQSEKGQAQALGNAMVNTFDLQNPLNDLLRAQTEALRG